MALSIYIKVSETEWRPALRMSKELGTDVDRDKILSKFARHIAKIYKDMLIEAINSQRFKGRWEPLSKDYLEFKRRNGLSTNTWEATELLKNSIDVWRLKDYYVVGVKHNILYPESRVPVYRVVRWMEYGTSRMPARPLFTPIKRYISNNMRNYWTEFIQNEGLVQK